VAAARLGPNPHAATIVEVARRYRIDPALLDAIVRQESGFNPAARSSKGALGLMQLMPATARDLGVRDPSRLTRDPALNLATGAAYLKRLQAQLGDDVPTVLAAYNAGPGAVKRYRGIPPYRETRAYVRSIMASYGRARGTGR
jgi:soluble lytic murein transglycosylase-like protein